MNKIELKLNGSEESTNILMSVTDEELEFLKRIIVLARINEPSWGVNVAVSILNDDGSEKIFFNADKSKDSNPDELAATGGVPPEGGVDKIVLRKCTKGALNDAEHHLYDWTIEEIEMPLNCEGRLIKNDE